MRNTVLNTKMCASNRHLDLPPPQLRRYNFVAVIHPSRLQPSALTVMSRVAAEATLMLWLPMATSSASANPREHFRVGRECHAIFDLLQGTGFSD